MWWVDAVDAVDAVAACVYGLDLWGFWVVVVGSFFVGLRRTESLSKLNSIDFALGECIDSGWLACRGIDFNVRANTFQHVFPSSP
jgi:hypothetical protein